MEENLIVVAGHAVYTGPDFQQPLDDANWFLLDYQKGEPPCYLEHMRRGVQLAAADPAGLLVFSGGPSRREAGPRSEALSYWILADHFGWWAHPQVRDRALTEEFSRDSFENLLYSICRFREWCGTYPRRVTVVSWAFKEERFGLHRAAIRFPSARFTFEGPNVPADLAAAGEGERRAIEDFTRNPYGDEARKQTRNPFRRYHGHAASCPELAHLLAHRGPEIYSGPLPW